MLADVDQRKAYSEDKPKNWTCLGTKLRYAVNLGEFGSGCDEHWSLAHNKKQCAAGSIEQRADEQVAE